MSLDHESIVPLGFAQLPPMITVASPSGSEAPYGFLYEFRTAAPQVAKGAKLVSAHGRIWARRLALQCPWVP